MINQWLHINTSVGDPWILPIWNAVNNAVQVGKVSSLPKDIREQLGLHISTRLDILPRVVARINTEVNKIYLAAKNHKSEHIFSANKDGYVFSIDNNIKFDLLTGIDSLFFEFTSICELMTNLFCAVYSNVGKHIKKDKAGITIKKIIEDAGESSDWFQQLVSHRNFFIHEGAPYFAIDISLSDGKYDLIIMKENIKRFNDESKFIKLSDINAIVAGFAVSKPIIQNHLIELYQKMP